MKADVLYDYKKDLQGLQRPSIRVLTVYALLGISEATVQATQKARQSTSIRQVIYIHKQ